MAKYLIDANLPRRLKVDTSKNPSPNQRRHDSLALMMTGR